MRTKTWLITSLISSLLLFLPGCLDIYLTTELFRNGEVEKTIVIKGDSTDILEAPFYFVNDDGWNRTWTEGDGDEKDQKRLILNRHFKSVKEMNLAMNPPDTSIRSIRVQSSLKRKFRWFFTYLNYSETIQKADPYNTQDWHDYLTEEEIKLLRVKSEEERKSDPNYDEKAYKQAEDHFSEFIMRSMFDSFMNTVETLLNNKPELQPLKAEIDAGREEFFRYLTDSTDTQDGDRIFMAMTDFFENISALNDLVNEHPEAFQDFNNKVDLLNKMGSNSYKFIIRMPGILMNTTSNQVQGTESRWELVMEDFYFDDYTLSCESRVINIWAFWVAGLILLLAIGTSTVGFIRRIRRQ